MNNIEEKIGFREIRNLLTGCCQCELGKDKVKEMVFLDSLPLFLHKLLETSEFCRIMEFDDFPDVYFCDVRDVLNRIRMEGAFAEADELLKLKRSLSAVESIVKYFCRQESGVFLFPSLHGLAVGVQCFPDIVKRLERIVGDDGLLKDSASAELSRIRRELSGLESRISRLLHSILSRAQADGLVGKDVSPAMRDGRLVIPVAPAMKRRLGGIVHDVSDSGRTVYIEPAEVVEANNNVRELINEERREELRILREVAAEMRPFCDEMLASFDFLAEVDFIQAKARFSRIIGAVVPTVKDYAVVDWSLAVHPLLKLAFDKRNRESAKVASDSSAHVVPLDIELDEKKGRILLISGPNAGGKSVCLKTVGLLQYMLQCGLPIPMAESSVCGVFKNIYVDIGDEQSIENDLSTYSSHLLNMKMMLRQADEYSLVLIDEFGSGTEPQIGGAIAEAVLKRLNNKHVFGVITTHYQNLKLFAQQNEGVVNGAMLYDRSQMRPLFQLRIGHPGSSFAIDIARRIGIPEEVIADASDIVGQEYINSDKYLQEIARDKRYWENKREAIHQQEKKLEQTLERYEESIQKLREQRKEIIDKARSEALQLINESNSRIEQTIRDIKEAQAEKERTKLIRQELVEFKGKVEATDQNDSQLLPHSAKKRNKKKQNTGNCQPIVSNTKEKTLAAPQEMTEGAFVRLKGQTITGKILKINGREALVAFGDVQTNVKINRLEHSEPPKSENRAFTFVGRQTQENIRKTSLNFNSEIDVRGMRAEEAIQAITYFVDDAIVSSAHHLRILHGTGSGILKTMIRQYLSTVPLVVRFHDEHPDFGGAGITLVDLE